MEPLLLLTMPGPIAGSIIILTVVVLIYSIAKALMRRIENKRDKEGRD